jgi:hypothetical protein
MKKVVLRSLFAVVLLSIWVTGAFAQKFEVHPYAGGLFMTDYSRSHFTREMDFVNPGMFGVKGSVAFTNRLRLEGNVGHVNQVTFRENPLRHDIHGLLWEGGGTYDLFRGRFGRVAPFVALGAGAFTLRVRSGAVGNFDRAQFALPVPEEMVGPFFFRQVEGMMVDDGDTFMHFSYGGGVKGERLWGPLGLRADVRGRTMPNFYGDAVSSLELTGGVLLSWGER